MKYDAPDVIKKWILNVDRCPLTYGVVVICEMMTFHAQLHIVMLNRTVALFTKRLAYERIFYPGLCVPGVCNRFFIFFLSSFLLIKVQTDFGYYFITWRALKQYVS